MDKEQEEALKLTKEELLAKLEHEEEELLAKLELGRLADPSPDEESPELLASLRRGIEQAEAGQLHTRGDFAQYVDDEEGSDGDR